MSSKKGNVFLPVLIFIIILLFTLTYFLYNYYIKGKVLPFIENYGAQHKIKIKNKQEVLLNNYLDGTLCLISDNINDKDNIISYLNLSEFQVKIYNPMSVDCELMKGCDYILLLDYSEDNKDNIKCIIKNYKTYIYYPAIKGSSIESLLVATSGSRVWVNGKVKPSSNCVYPYCYYQKRYTGYLYNAICFNTPTQTVYDYPFTCYDSQHLLLFFNFYQILQREPKLILKILQTT